MAAMNQGAAGPVEVWAARAWNVLNEGRPFSVVYPVLVLLAAAATGLGPGGSLGLALVGAVLMASVLACFTFPLRGRTLLWLSALACVALLEPWRAPALLAAALCAALGLVAWQRFAARRLPGYPEPVPTAPGPALARRVYVVVVDGANRERLWQADTPVIDRLAREGTEYLAVEPAYPARTVVCFSSMLTGATPDEHGMRSNFVARLGVRAESIFDVLERYGRRGRLVGIAHLLDPFGEGVVRSVTSVQPSGRIDHSLSAEARRVVDDEDPDLLVLQLLAADELGHVRGVRNTEYLEQLADTDRRVGDFLAFLDERGKLDDATVVLMADHGQGRGIGGHGHLDWGESPVPLVVWGEGAVPGASSREPHSVLELAATIAELLGVERPAAARGRPLVPAGDPGLEAARASGGRCLAVLPAHDEEGAIAGVIAGIPRSACGMSVDLLVVDDGSRDATAHIAREHGARVIA